MNMTNDIDIETLRGVSSAAISDALDTLSRKQWVLAQPVRLIVGQRIFGRAVVVMMSPTGEKALHKVGIKALDESAEGSVIVLAGDPDPVASAFGPAEIAVATRRKLGGLLTDCFVRTASVMLDEPLGVGAAGRSPAGGFGRFKTLVLADSTVCCGVVIETGDVIVGDADGIVVLPLKYVEKVIAIVRHYATRPARMVIDVSKGATLQQAFDDHWDA
jgi:4-hydroxy-4-methyl-2-oxoglutarate aldolase